MMLGGIIIDNDTQILQDLIRVTQAINDENYQNNTQMLLELATVSAVGEANNALGAYKRCLRDSVNNRDFGIILKEVPTTMLTNHDRSVQIAKSSL
ncbi:hypothetical protein TNCT_201461 [Trichonephila clavata]|uniref:Uncharacterized protein n=1 Tax=Trichonephila clavata TaxID=2740835 RepID=A0A8X6LN06_TRICU|nr:hypothetical protein TNCT_201461 [Trichonephila clavata]